MSRRWQISLLLIALAFLAPAVWHVASALPPFGSPTSLYGVAINEFLPTTRHVTNMVAAVNFDVRGFDTLGEECMLVCAVTGAVILLRGSRGENLTARAGRVPGRAIADRLDAIALVCGIASALLFVFGLYMILHGTVTPGGGFQGGVIIASGFVLIYLGGGYPQWRTFMVTPLLEALEGGGAFLFVMVAAYPLVLGHPAMTNLLPFGTPKDLFSGGAMVISNFAVGLSVTGSFALLLLEFMEETRAPETDSLLDESD